MLNKKPIILNCFSRGGSNIIWNYFISHPLVCHPIEETLQIFNINWKSPRFVGYKALILAGQHLFDQWKLNERLSINKKTKEYIDISLFQKKLNTYSDDYMKYKYENEEYSLDEVKNSRLVIKNNNGLIFCSNIFYEMYPGAVFIGLVRHPVALYESHRRRKTPVSTTIEAFVEYYQKMIQKMLDDQDRFENYHIIKFEKLLADPMESIKKLYLWADLDYSQLKKVRLKAKEYMHDDGVSKTSYETGYHYWLTKEELNFFLDPNVNRNQRNLILEEDVKKISFYLKDSMKKLNYH